MGEFSNHFLPYAEHIAVSLLGKPTHRSPRELRWGRKGSFSVTVAGPRAGHFHDFETGRGGDLLDLVTRETGLDLHAALEWMRSCTGVAAPVAASTTQSISPYEPLVWSEKAQAIWSRSTPLAGTLGETYLTGRRCYSPDVSDLRFLPGGNYPPALVARVTNFDTGEPMTLTFIRLDPLTGRKVGGLGAKACLSGHRKNGGVVRLSRILEVGGRLGIAEGIETAMTVISEGHGPAWAALGADNLKRLAPSSRYGELVIWADNDQAGRTAADDMAARWKGKGHLVRIAAPSDPGSDWNDVVMASELGDGR